MNPGMQFHSCPFNHMLLLKHLLGHDASLCKVTNQTSDRPRVPSPKLLFLQSHVYCDKVYYAHQLTLHFAMLAGPLSPQHIHPSQQSLKRELHPTKRGTLRNDTWCVIRQTPPRSPAPFRPSTVFRPGRSVTQSMISKVVVSFAVTRKAKYAKAVSCQLYQRRPRPRNRRSRNSCSLCWEFSKALRADDAVP